MIEYPDRFPLTPLFVPPKEDTGWSVHIEGSLHMLKRMDCDGLTDLGRKRLRNEDQFLIADLNKSMRIHATSLDIESQTRLFGGSQGKLLLVADGMGGHSSGDRASSIAVDSIVHYILNAMHWMFQLDRDPEADFVESLKASLRQSHQRIRDEAELLPQRKGMGTTVTMAYLIWPRLYIVHVGDSRCYALRGQELKQLTRDHNLAERMVEEGAMDREEASHSFMQNIIWNVLGGSEGQMAPEVTIWDLEIGDSILLCTDGLTKHVTDKEIAQALDQPLSARAICQQLVDKANSKGGSDNITTIVAHFHSQPGNLLASHAAVEDTVEQTVGEPLDSPNLSAMTMGGEEELN